MKVRFRRICVIGAATYIVASTLIAGYAEVRCRISLRLTMMSIGKLHFHDYEAYSKDFIAHSPTNKYKPIFLWTPPYGWMVRARIERTENALLYASKNFGLPEGQRFTDTDEAKHYGFNPSHQSEEQINEAIVELLR